MNDQNRIYHVVAYPDRRAPYSFAGTNAKRDAERLAKRTGGRLKTMTGAEWIELTAKH